MSEDVPEVEPPASTRPLIVAVVILLASGAAGWWVLESGPKQQKTAKTATIPAVEVIGRVASSRPVTIRAFGTVEPAREVTLSPEVEGRVVAMHEALQPGAIVKEGDLLLRVDPAGYRIAVRRADAALESANAELAIESGQRKVAEREWELFSGQPPGTTTTAAPSAALALREPQMQQARARVATAEAMLAEARLLLQRTELRAPFDAFVRDESVEIGRRVSPATPVLVALPAARVALGGMIVSTQPRPEPGE